MKKIIKPNLLSVFSFELFGLEKVKHKQWRVRHVDRLQPLSLLLFLVFVILLQAFSKIEWLYLGISVFSYMAYLYFCTYTIAKNLRVERSLSSIDLTEEDRIEINWKIANQSNHNIHSFQVYDHFGPAQNPTVDIASEINIAGQSLFKLKQKVVCDGGMGKRHLGPLTVTVKDAFGLFTFKVLFDQITELKVLPKIKPINDIKLQPMNANSTFGNYEVAGIGQNTNFSGVREYKFGDSLRHISWRLSASANKLLVKEFEKSISCTVGVIMNLDPQFQLGRRVHSSWELIRDTSLSIVSQNIKQGHLVSFLSNFFYLSANHSESHLNQICKKVSSIEFLDDHGEVNLSDNKVAKSQTLFESSEALMQDCQAIFLITPMSMKQELAIKKLAHFCKSRNIELHIVFVDVRGFVADLPADLKYDFIALSSHYKPEEWKNFTLQLSAAGVVPYLIGPKQKFDFEKNCLRDVG